MLSKSRLRWSCILAGMMIDFSDCVLLQTLFLQSPLNPRVRFQWYEVGMRMHESSWYANLCFKIFINSFEILTSFTSRLNYKTFPCTLTFVAKIPLFFQKLWPRTSDESNLHSMPMKSLLKGKCNIATFERIRVFFKQGCKVWYSL